jgi:hypothetical protein
MAYEEVAAAAIVFVFNVLVEYGIIKLFCRRLLKPVFLSVLFVNLITWPLLTMFVPFGWLLVPAEILVVIVEAVLLKYLLDVSYARAGVMSLVANLVSFLLGLIFWFLFEMAFIGIALLFRIH